METGRSDDPSRDVVVCANVLGSFGVAPDDIRAQRREYRTAVPPGQEERSLESILSDVLADARDRTATVRQLVCRGDRGLTCSARYAQRALGRKLEAVFDAIGWEFEWTRTGPAENGRDRLELAATDPNGREREATVAYPQTPLDDDNLPAVLRAVDERLLAGTDATIVLLSAGVDRWRAALVEEGELEALRDRYGERISAFDRPLLPTHDLAAYVPEAPGDEIDPTDATESDPWPAWALERAERRLDSLGSAVETEAAAPGDERESVASLIDEAEPERTSTARTDDVPTDDTATDASGSTQKSSSTTATSAPSTAAGGFELRGGSPTVSRVRDDSDTSAGASLRDVADSILETERERAAGRGDRSDTDGDDESEAEDEDDSSDDGFGTLSGTTKTTRVTNDSFGAGEEFATENDRYRALGVALGAGGAVDVEGLLEDDDFLPELPASGPSETRIEFADEFDPAAVPETTASAEQSGFEWVDSGRLETTRLSND
ncbi:hypothetical protein C477_05631 [Haloterrigena salina JCM 13891]|uniref:Uncharacterized protein n=1 Tax=Haloterrigena salina JCM 13891 TaxID=1227488 RepID=M0CI41_9EURY|nr:hypothetical protein [Haloterrigena salina]ELZ21534.1 hypothetical protein C477_05631 [Haloterrigena salina JCM 13891]